MKISITAIRSKDIPYSGGTFRKFEVKTDKTGDEILELRLGKEQNAKAKKGDIIEGYIEKSFYTGKNGRVETKLLKRINADYVYKLILLLAPGIESKLSESAPSDAQGFDDKPAQVDDGFGTPPIPEPAPGESSDIGF